MFAASKSGRAGGGGPGPGPTDASFGYVPLLLETGSSSSLNTTVTDSSASPNTVTRTANPSTGWVSPYQTDGYWGNQFNGSTDYLSSTTATTVFQFGSNPYTVEGWIYLLSIPNTKYICGGTFSGTGFQVGIDTSRFLIVSVPGSSPFTSPTTAIPLNTWTHFAIVRTSTSTNGLAYYINGAAAGTATDSTNYSGTATTLQIASTAGTAGFAINAYLSNFRVVKGVAVYTGAFTPPTSPLAATQSGNGSTIQAITGTQTSLLTCQSNRFKDNSAQVTPATLTPTGTPQVTPYFYPSGFTAPAASPGAALLNGSTQYLSTPQTAGGPLDLTSGTFTLESWVYPTSFNSSQATIAGTRGAVGGNWELRLTTSGAIQFYYTGGSLVGTSAVLPLNAWSHVAVVRSSNTVTIYLNGVSSGSLGSFGDGVGRTGPLLIGIETTSATNDAFPGYIGNFRIVKGTAVYTGAFTPPSGPLTQTGGTYPSLTNVVTGFTAANTSLLLAMSDSNYLSATNGVQNNTFIDESNYAFPITRNGTPTQGSITPYWPNGQWSNYFNGSSQLTLPNNAGFEIGAGNFSYEAFVYATQGTNTYTQSIINYGNASSLGPDFVGMDISNTGYFAFAYATGSVYTLIDPALFPLNQWVHCVACRSGSTLSIFVNGVRKATTTTSATVGAGGLLAIGGQIYAVESLRQLQKGYISNVRILKGASAYDATLSTLTVPTAPLPTNTANQQLLTCYSNRFIDANTATSPKAISPVGAPTVQAFQPFSPTASYTTALYGGSSFLPTSADYLSIAADATFTFGTQNHTIEFWAYQTAFTNYSSPWNYASGATVQGTGNYYISNGGLSSNLLLGSGGAWGVNIAFTQQTLNAWHHYAITRSGSSFALFIDGVRAGTATYAGSITAQAGAMLIGRATGISDTYQGYISNLRIVKGTAVYDPAQTTITVPTSPLTAITNTVLLVNGTNAAIYDAAVQNDVTTVSNAQVSIAQAQFPPSSIFFNGATSSLSIPSSTAFGLGTGDWTIEFWVYLNAAPPTSVTLVSMLTNVSGAGFAPHIYCVTGGGLRYYTNSADRITGGVLASGVWNYVAVSKASGNTRMYINGTQTGSTYADSNNYGTSNPFAVADYAVPLANGTVNGYFQDVRITKGVGRTITASPTAPFPTR
jgi:hypothetical protein